MRRFKFEKLVRDKIVESIEGHGNVPHYRTLSDEEFAVELKKKLIEEAKELIEAQGDEIIKEIADIQEIIDNLLKTLDISKENLEFAQNVKNDKNGSLKKKHYIEYVDVKEGSPEIEYYLKFAEKYPEIV